MAKKQVKIGPYVIRPHIRDGAATGKWQIDIPAEYSPTGRRKRKSFKNKAQAEQVAREEVRRLQLKGQANPFGHDKVGVTFEELAQRWFEEQEERVSTLKKRQSSLLTAAYQLRSLLRNFRNLDTSAITADTVVRYQKTRLEEGIGPATINSEVARLVQVLRWGLDRGLSFKVPRTENMRETKRRLDLPTQEEIKLLLANLNPASTRILVRLIAETGLRKSEAFNLHWDDLNYEEGTIYVRPNDQFQLKNETSQRKITISRSILAEISTLPRENHLVFPGKGGKVRTNISKALDTAVRSAGLMRDGRPMKVRLHMLRKAHATWQAERNVPEHILQRRLGHVEGSRVTKEIYVHASQKASDEAIIDLSDTENSKGK